MNKSIWSANKLITKEEKEKADRFSKLATRAVLIIMWSVVMIMLGLTGGFELGEESGYKTGEKDGYNRAKQIYECNHDYAEHEILPENYKE